MFDWFSGLLGYDAKGLKPDSVLRVSPEGEVKWRSEASIEALGSYDANIYVKPMPAHPDMLKQQEEAGFLTANTVLRIDGNPSKFLQGHNVFGPSVSQQTEVLTAVVQRLSETLDIPHAYSRLGRAIHRNRVDITTAVDLGDNKTVNEWLQFAANNTRSRHRSGVILEGSTLYYGKRSRHWTLKLYNKHQELIAHPVKDKQLQALLVDYTIGQLRIELTLRTRMLQPDTAFVHRTWREDGYLCEGWWTEPATFDEDIIWRYFERVEMNNMKKATEQNNVDITGGAFKTFYEWNYGVSVKDTLPKNTFYRHRREIMAKTGFDISLPVPDKKDLDKNAEILDIDFLKAHEIKVVPASLQGYLFKATT